MPKKFVIFESFFEGGKILSVWNGEIVHYDTSAMKSFLTSVSLQHEPKASDVITLVKKTFFRTSIVRNFISRGVTMRISAREACIKPHLRTRSDIKEIFTCFYFYKIWLLIGRGSTFDFFIFEFMFLFWIMRVLKIYDNLSNWKFFERYKFEIFEINQTGNFLNFLNWKLLEFLKFSKL